MARPLLFLVSWINSKILTEILQKVKSYFFGNIYQSPFDSYWNSKKSIKLKPPTIYFLLGHAIISPPSRTVYWRKNMARGEIKSCFSSLRNRFFLLKLKVRSRSCKFWLLSSEKYYRMSVLWRIRILFFTFMRIQIRVLPSFWRWSRSWSYLSLWGGSGSYHSLFSRPSNALEWPYKASTFSLWCVARSGSCLSLDADADPAFHIDADPGTDPSGHGSSFPKWCGPMRIRIRNTGTRVPVCPVQDPQLCIFSL
jgi:hypothetical protein